MPEMPGARAFPMLSVEDLSRARAFYCELLGFSEAYRFPPDSPAFIAVSLGGSEVGLGKLGDGPALHGQPLRPATGHRMELCVYVDDLDQTMERMRERRVRVHLEPTTQPWGERVAYVEDPDGNLVMLCAPNAS